MVASLDAIHSASKPMSVCAGFNRPRVSVSATPTTTIAPAGVKVVNEKVAPLFTPFKLGKFDLKNRMVYPPLTRMRSTPDNVPRSELMAKYYSQRATDGSLFIAEGTYINPQSNGYPCAPGIWNEKQVEAWRPVTKAVKDKGAVFFCQLWHCGRASHPALQPNGALPVAPSPIRIGGDNKVFLPDFSPADYPVPQELDHAGIKATIQDYANAARNAIAAGFDGVEIHGANGYLIDQFIKDSSNKRTDEYGGSIENRCRFALEVVEAVVAAVGAERVGIRLSPFTTFLEAVASKPYGTFSYLVESLNQYKLAYVHMIEARAQGNDIDPHAVGNLEPFRKIWEGPFIAAGGYNAESAAHAVATGHADLIAFGRWWIANPDLPKRFALDAPLNKYDRNTFYGGDEKGYVDYPYLEETEAGDGNGNGNNN